MQISAEAQDFMVEEYKRLRQRDSSGGTSKTSWRITVRQLESMIRLSEAMARLYCQDQVHVSTSVKHRFSLDQLLLLIVGMERKELGKIAMGSLDKVTGQNGNRLLHGNFKEKISLYVGYYPRMSILYYTVYVYTV